MGDWQRARLIPTSGIKSAAEAEVRASSALLAVLSVVRPFSKGLLSPLGASRADRASVETFIEVPHKAPSGRTVRPDGLIRVTYGKQPPWVALVEVKTGSGRLGADQVNEYWDIARGERYDCVITISNEIAPAPGVHPVDGLRVLAISPVSVHHWSWTLILTEAVKHKVHRGVDDPEQAWILGELIRYLEHPSSGAMEFDDMGTNWVAVRDGAHASRLNRRDPAVTEIAQRWDQLMRYSTLQLASETGSDVQEIVPRSHQQDPSLRTREMVDSLCENSRLNGDIRVPDTAGDIHVSVDFRARQIECWTDLPAPDDRGGRARITWLTRQLQSAPSNTRVEAFAKNVRVPESADLADTIEDPSLLLGSDKRSPVRFRVATTSQMGTNRRSGRSPGFVQSVLDAVAGFYENVLQNVTPFQRRAPKRKPHELQARPDEVTDQATPTEEPSEAGHEASAIPLDYS